MPTIGVDFALRLDGLSLVFALLVLGIGALVFVYAARYLGRGQHTGFYVLMTTFAAAMLILVLADDLVVLFVAWEATTLCSFFLISRSGHNAREPAIRTLLVTAFGGLCLLAAVALMTVNTGTSKISAILVDPVWNDNSTFTVVVAVLLAVAAFTKSAQFPFQFWLPDSMVAITPVSTYLHAATMVKAGVFLLLRFSPVMAEVSIWNILLISSGLITALLGAVGALRQHDLKALLAHSTVSQLGLIITLIGLGTPAAITAAIVFTIGHAFFKAALFMLVGVIDHEAGTRDIRQLAHMRLKTPVTMIAMGLAAASMAGIPPLLGFISKESMFGAIVDASGPPIVTTGITVLAVLVSICTFAYSGRILIGAFSGQEGPLIREASSFLLIAPVVCAVVGLGWGLLSFTLDSLISGAATASVGRDISTHLTLWHGINIALILSITVFVLGTAMIVRRASLDAPLRTLQLRVSGVCIVQRLRTSTIQLGTHVASAAGTTDPRRHLAIPVACMVAIAAAGAAGINNIPASIGNPSHPRDWVLVILIAAGVLAAISVRTRISAIVVTGVVGFAMTVWFVNLGAADVAMTQLLVEILTVGVMVLVLQRLPRSFSRSPAPRSPWPMLLAILAGGATTLGVWALTGRREPSQASQYYLHEGEQVTGGANIVNTILVDFRALDTLGEMTVLGLAGVTIAALISVRRLLPIPQLDLLTSSPLANAEENSVFVRTVALRIIPLLAIVSLVLLWRGHQEPGGGFIAALVSGAGFTLVYLAAPSNDEARIRWPYLVLIGTGVVVGTGTGLLGYIHGSFLAPLQVEILGTKITSALIFDIGVYLTVIGILVAAFNLLGQRRKSRHRPASITPSPLRHEGASQ